MPDYTVKTAGFILGEYRNVNKTVTMTEKQATPFLREGRIVPKKADDKPAKAGAKS